MKLTADKLRERAKLLLKRANELENARAIKIGKLVIAYEQKGFEGITIEKLIDQISKIK